jgi:hypothetical protein
VSWRVFKNPLSLFIGGITAGTARPRRRNHLKRLSALSGNRAPISLFSQLAPAWPLCLSRGGDASAERDGNRLQQSLHPNSRPLAPRAAGMLRSFKPAAMARSDFHPRASRPARRCHPLPADRRGNRAHLSSWRARNGDPGGAGTKRHSAGARHLGPAARVRTATWGRSAPNHAKCSIVPRKGLVL